ncbi:hypothetical protein F511_44049 [Dorcoceras hygrometricum]|uniref:Uncharacterized protein n=1 Tax=Dorcoceras hygrometricum TaxID=472368 RepID=A0A2Z7CFC7_9LAMI|nr:hypothetical protein F511_44049 [Dorcoceras hygrometricum]
MNAGSSSETRQSDDVLCRKPDASSFCLRRTRVNGSSFRGIQISRGGRNLLALVWLRDLVREREMSVEEAREKSGCILRADVNLCYALLSSVMLCYALLYSVLRYVISVYVYEYLLCYHMLSVSPNTHPLLLHPDKNEEQVEEEEREQFWGW